MRFNRVKITQGGKELTVMVGRKRKVGKREKNGRPQRDKRETPEMRAASMPHRAWIPPKRDHRGKLVDQRRDDKAENPFGRLLLIGNITPSEYNAGQLFLIDYRRYRVVIDSPREAPSLTGRISRSDYSEGDAPIPFRLQKPLSDKEALDRTNAYQRAIEAVKTLPDGVSPARRHNLLVLNSVVIHERELQPGDLEFLQAALRRLEKHYAKRSVA